ncbi:MAG: hypothetical protein DSM106950_24415 [Stigonema ocellatum SAG 48.90 = DSM 106950]|nr:hypothetical protein [Stigonema ocellatum SAG 48.90 = DSM 106950]
MGFDHLKCVGGCENVVLFWSDRTKQCEQPQPKKATNGQCVPTPAQQTAYPCSVCFQPLLEYPYEKDGQQKRLLRCSNPSARKDKEHKQAVYFLTASGWCAACGALLIPICIHNRNKRNSGVAECSYELTFFDMIKQRFFAALRLCVRLIHTLNQQRLVLALLNGRMN